MSRNPAGRSGRSILAATLLFALGGASPLLAQPVDWIESGAFGDAKFALDQVRLDGPFSNQALLSAGWADLSAERYERALERLKPASREAVVARVEMGFSYRQVATELGKPSPDAARMAVSRALAQLAREMAGD